jgi:hypothetical protein
MRTTIQIDDDVLQAARSLARAESKPLGKVISDLARQALAPKPQRGARKGFPTFEIPSDAPPLTAETVRQADEPD